MADFRRDSDLFDSFRFGEIFLSLFLASVSIQKENKSGLFEGVSIDLKFLVFVFTTCAGPIFGNIFPKANKYVSNT